MCIRDRALLGHHAKCAGYCWDRIHYCVWRYHHVCTAQSDLNPLICANLCHRLFNTKALYEIVFIGLFGYAAYITHMNRKDCNTCEISANQLMDECPSCGAQFEHLSTDARVYGVIALLVVFGISLLLSAG